MSELATLLRGYGPLLIFLGSICVIFGWSVAMLEWNRQPKGTPTASWSVAAVAVVLSLIGATLLLLLDPLRLLWGTAVLAMSVAVVTIVATGIIGVLALAAVERT